jgi:type II secretory pathway predicted ATPase ExeA
MYHAHFGLVRGLFADGIAADAAVFRTSRHDQLIAQCKLALAAPTSCLVLQGPAGVGKTTLTSTALRASTTRLATAWVNGMATNAAELLELVLVELGISTLRTTRIERLQLWRQFQGEMRATDSRLFIVAERTEDLAPEVLHALDQLTAPDAVGNPGANLVLLGHSGIQEHLATPLLDSLRQRIRLRAELEPFTEAELQDFLRHQVACAGGHYDRIFAPGTVGALYRYSGGVTRLAITLCESALDVAATDWHKQLTAEIVAKTATSFLGLTATAAAQAAPVRVEAPPSAQPRAVSAPPSSATPAASRPQESRAPAPPPPAPASGVTARPAPPASATSAAPRPQEFRAPAPQPPALAPAASARPAPPPAPLMPPPAAEVEYDGSATDVADVALADFPILTDAVEIPPLAASKPSAAPSNGTLTVPPLWAPTPAATTAVTAPAAPTAARAPAAPSGAKPPSRSEPAPAASRPAVKAPASPAPPATAAAAPAPAPAATQRPAPAKPAAPAPPAAPARVAAPPPDPAADDLLRQTQSMRAISVAKSIDDISEIDAETLFSDAELDLVAAALASAAEWADEEEDTVPAAQATPSKPVAAKPATAKTLPPDDDLLGLLGLSDNAPLELIDDSADPNDRQRKSAAR